MSKLMRPTHVSASQTFDMTSGSGQSWNKPLPLPHFSNFSTRLLAKTTDMVVARLAYVAGKIYYLTSERKARAVLAASDVTVAVDCDAVMRKFAPTFRAWKVDVAAVGKLGMSEDFSPGETRTEHLHETSLLAPAMPWYLTHSNYTQIPKLTQSSYKNCYVRVVYT